MKTQVKTAHSTFAGDQLYICFTGETSMLGILTRNDFEYPKKKLDKDIYFSRWALLEMWSVFVFLFFPHQVSKVLMALHSFCSLC